MKTQSELFPDSAEPKPITDIDELAHHIAAHGHASTDEPVQSNASQPNHLRTGGPMEASPEEMRQLTTEQRMEIARQLRIVKSSIK